ncbi:Bidirectional sugar transporter SWEET1-like protein [Drosera capensis]
MIALLSTPTLCWLDIRSVSPSHCHSAKRMLATSRGLSIHTSNLARLGSRLDFTNTRRRWTSLVTQAGLTSNSFVLAFALPLGLLVITIVTAWRIGDQLDQKFLEELAINEAIREADEVEDEDNDMVIPVPEEPARPRTRNATALFLFLAPTVTFRRIIKNRSTEQFSGLPYVMTLLNCLLSAWYGLPFISPNNILVATINGTGAAIETVYVLIYLVFAPRREKLKIGGLFVSVLALFSVVALVSLLALHGHSRKLFCGFAATIFSIIMYGSPLSIMRMVMKTKSVEYMPFLLSLFVFLCGTSWFIYGLLGRDPFVYVPNGVGSGLGAMQLILYFIYYDKTKTASSFEKPTLRATTTTVFDNQDAMEMGLENNDKASVQQPL